MSGLYTKNGVPLKVSGKNIFNPSGRQFGRISGSKVYGSDGRYVGTIVGDRLVHKSTDSASIGSPFAPSISSSSAQAHRVGAAIWGDEPDIGE
jgi:hypothetical protein